VLKKELLDVAQELYEADNVTEAHIRRSISTTYYAIFQYFCNSVSSEFLGDDEDLSRAKEHLKRSIQHKPLVNRCHIANSNRYKKSNLEFPEEVRSFAFAICSAQSQRELADYDTNYQFEKKDAELLHQQVSTAIDDFEKIDAKHRKAFYVWALIEPKNLSK